MWLEQLTLVLLSVSLVIPDPIAVVLGEKPLIKVPLGSSVDFKCQLKTENSTRLRVQWSFSSAACSNNATISEWTFKKRITENVSINGSLNGTQQDPGAADRGRTYRLANVTEGCYYCNITAEIPTLKEYKSNGTYIVITDVGSKPALDQWMWISLAVSSLLMVVLLLICVSLSRRRCRRRGEEPIYANTRPVPSKQPSPRPGSDQLKDPSSHQNIHKPSRKYNEGKRRYK